MNNPRLQERLRRPFANRSALILFAIMSILLALVVSPRHGKTANQVGPRLLANGLNRAIALESVTHCAEPFAPTAVVPFSQDVRTRVMLFATELGLGPGEGAAAVAAQAEDASGTPYPLTVEYAGAVAGFDMAAVIVRLDGLGDVGDVSVSVTVHGMTSNASSLVSVISVGYRTLGQAPA